MNHKGYHHYHQRKRIHLKKQSYPSKNPFKKFLDNAVYLIITIGILFTLPQVFKIWVGKDATGVSAISWLAYAFTSTYWLIYGIAHNEKPIIVNSVIWIALDIFIVIGTLIYS
ncbi:hypothetical protein HOF78_01400 [Candidatus Woesearchaeota archaeon]|jgi:uncharacterized protein with PQ loop repeat|nr:hypothetical protein [Candidatus Woesearchaeota archaeon]MBT6044960.1 hypothetical protein [Candidatus Woesearchaeota archaeon]